MSSNETSSNSNKMSYNKHPERRTFLQDRFEILIKRQKEGRATFSELTELDEIVNRDPELREKVFRESILMESPDDESGSLNNPGEDIYQLPVVNKNLLTRIKEVLARIFISRITTAKNRVLAYNAGRAIPIF